MKDDALKPLVSVGDHGYDNLLPSMHPFMAASGPSFRQDYKMQTLQSVDLYPLMCYLLQIPPQPNNGTLSNAKCLMASTVSGEGFLVVSLALGVIMFIVTITSKWKHVWVGVVRSLAVGFSGLSCFR